MFFFNESRPSYRVISIKWLYRFFHKIVWWNAQKIKLYEINEKKDNANIDNEMMKYDVDDDDDVVDDDDDDDDVDDDEDDDEDEMRKWW